MNSEGANVCTFVVLNILKTYNESINSEYALNIKVRFGG